MPRNVIERTFDAIGIASDAFVTAMKAQDKASKLNQEFIDQNINQRNLTDIEKIGILKDKLDDCKRERRWYEPQWALNRAFYVGNQWAEWNFQNHRIVVPPEKRVRITINRIRSTVRNLVAKLTRNRPKLQALPPDTGDPDDKDTSKVSEIYLDYILEKLKYRELLQDALQWFYVEGKSFLWANYNPNAGNVVNATIPVTKMKAVDIERLDAEGRLVDVVKSEQIVYSGEWPIDRKGKPIRFEEVDTPDELTDSDLEKQFVYAEGEIDVEVVPLHEVYWQAGAKKLDDCRYIFIARAQLLEDVRENPLFKNVEQIVPDEDYDLDYTYESNIGIGMYRSWYGYRTEATPARGRACTVVTYLERPSPSRPRGRMICFAGNVILHDGDLPTGEFPIIELKELNEPNRFAPSAMVEQLIPPQYAYNLASSQVLEYVKQTIVGNWVYKKNTVENPPTGFAGEHIQYIGESAPRRMDQPPLPSTVFNSLEVTKNDISELSGLYETSKGIAVGGIRSGVHARLLMEADDTKLGPVADLVEMATETLGNIILNFAREFYTEERIIKYVGENRKVQVQKFLGAELIADVRVVQGSALTKSKILRMDEVFNKWQAGFYGHPADPKVLRYVHKLMDEGVNLPKSSLDEAQELKAKEENKAAIMFGLPEPAPWDDDEIHDSIHTEWFFTSDGMNAPLELKAMMWNHINAHRKRHAEKYAPNYAQIKQAEANAQRQPSSVSPQNVPSSGTFEGENELA